MSTALRRRCVGMDLHRRRSVIVKMGEHGKVLGTRRVTNEPLEVVAAVTAGGEDLEVGGRHRW